MGGQSAPARRPVVPAAGVPADCPERALTERIIGCAIEVHRALGPGYLESIYENALINELIRQGLAVDNQRLVEVLYKGSRVGWHRIDLIVEDKVIVELKHVEAIVSRHVAQAMSTAKAAGVKVGLLINFNEAKLVDGVRRVIV